MKLSSTQENEDTKKLFASSRSCLFQVSMVKSLVLELWDRAWQCVLTWHRLGPEVLFLSMASGTNVSRRHSSTASEADRAGGWKATQATQATAELPHPQRGLHPDTIRMRDEKVNQKGTKSQTPK